MLTLVLGLGLGLGLALLDGGGNADASVSLEALIFSCIDYFLLWKEILKLTLVSLSRLIVIIMSLPLRDAMVMVREKVKGKNGVLSLLTRRRTGWTVAQRRRRRRKERITILKMEYRAEPGRGFSSLGVKLMVRMRILYLGY